MNEVTLFAILRDMLAEQKRTNELLAALLTRNDLKRG